MKMIIQLVGYHHVDVEVQQNGFMKNVFKDGLMKNNNDQVEVNVPEVFLFLDFHSFFLDQVLCSQCNAEYIIVYPKQGIKERIR